MPRNVWVVEQPLEQVDGSGVLREEPASLVEGPVAGDAQDGMFVGWGDDAEQRLGAGGYVGALASTIVLPRPGRSRSADGQERHMNAVSDTAVRDRALTWAASSRSWPPNSTTARPLPRPLRRPGPLPGVSRTGWPLPSPADIC